jgi:uncharacterized protein (DUF4415 family)
MEKKGRIVRATGEEIDAMIRAGKTYSNWEAAERIPQADVERMADEDDGPLPEGWEDTVIIGIPEPAKSVSIRIDAAVLRWFKASGPGYQTRINDVLRAFVRAKERTGTVQNVATPGNRTPRRPTDRRA